MVSYWAADPNSFVMHCLARSLSQGPSQRSLCCSTSQVRPKKWARDQHGSMSAGLVRVLAERLRRSSTRFLSSGFSCATRCVVGVIFWADSEFGIHANLLAMGLLPVRDSGGSHEITGRPSVESPPIYVRMRKTERVDTE